MPTWQGIEFLERVLDALAGQRAEIPWDLHVVDSGSTDGTWEQLEARRAGFPVPFHAVRIQPAEFDHGDTRNLLAARSTGDLLVYMSQDAIPSTPDWLSLLVRNFQDPAVGAAYCRNVARADARLLTKVFCRSDPGYAPERAETRMPDAVTWSRMSVDERRVVCNFNDVASAIRRELWELHPFPRTMMGEDVLMARAILEAGHAIVYDAQATVDHSHDYGPEKMRWRGQVDARFNVEFMQRTCVRDERDVEALTVHLVSGDMALLEKLGTPAAEMASLRREARELRGALARGLYEGGLSPRRYPGTVLRTRRDLNVLYVVQDPVPDGRTDPLALARALRRRGHRVGLFSVGRADANGAAGSWRQVDGVAVIRAGTAALPREIAADFRRVLAEEQPDVVHFLTVRESTLDFLCATRAAGVRSVASLDHVTLAQKGALAAAWLSDLRLCSDVALRQALLAATDFDPQTLAFCERPGNGATADPRVDEAADLEYRYRALGCIVQDGGCDEPLFDAKGAAATTHGPTERQDDGWLLLRPGSWAEYSLQGVPTGSVVLDLEQHVLASEPEIVFAGRVTIDGQEVGRLTPARGTDGDRTVRHSLLIDVPAGARVLRLEPRLHHEPAHLRVCRLTLVRARRSEMTRLARASRPAADLPTLFEELRVVPGAPVDRRDLPRVTVVVPNYNGRAVLADCLESIGALDYPRERLDVVVVDNGSTDVSVALLRSRFPQVRLVLHERNLGFAAACNAGARDSTSPVVAFLNNDMRFERDFLLELVAPLVRRECAMTTAKILSWDGRTIDTSGTGATVLGIAVQPGYGEPPRPEHDVPRKTLFGCGGAMAADAAVLRDVGGFDEAYFAYYEDLDLGWRTWLMGHEIHYVPTALCYHHHSHTSKRLPAEGVRLAMIRNSLFTCVKNYDDENLARVLPAMIALAVRRAHFKAGLDDRPFRIDQAQRAGGSWTNEFLAQRPVPIQRLGAADLIAIDDLLANWDHWMSRRREVQDRRKRGDAEIQRLFLDPLACVEGDAAYAALQTGLYARFGLDETFGRS
jgi:GT2 family glycosyltransferase